MATFKLYGNLEPLVESRGLIVIPAASVRSGIQALMEQFPALAGELLLADGEYNRYYSILVNGEMIEFLDDLDTQLGEGDEVAFFPPMPA